MHHVFENVGFWCRWERVWRHSLCQCRIVVGDQSSDWSPVLHEYFELMWACCKKRNQAGGPQERRGTQCPDVNIWFSDHWSEEQIQQANYAAPHPLPQHRNASTNTGCNALSWRQCLHPVTVGNTLMVRTGRRKRSKGREEKEKKEGWTIRGSEVGGRREEVCWMERRQGVLTAANHNSTAANMIPLVLISLKD